MTKKNDMNRRSFLKSSAASLAGAAGANSFFVNHAWSQDVIWDGQPFDAGGATLNLNEWGGFWEEAQRDAIINDFEKTFNCTVAYDSSFPWFPKYIAGGPQDPSHHVGNWNLNEIIKLNRIGDFFLSTDEIKASVPNAADVWDFAFGSGLGVTWGYGQYVYVYRTDKVDPAPTSFKDFWRPELAGKRGTYITSNGLQQVFFMTAAAEWGKDQYDLEAGYEAMRSAMPMKISDFTGNMQTLVERGEVEMAVQWQGEAFLQMDKGIAVAPFEWERKPILTQTLSISRYSDPVEKKLALAYLNAKLDAEYQTKMSETFYLRPSNKGSILPERLKSKGVTNTADAIEGFWIPDWNWYLDNEDDIVETVNGIFAG